MANFFTRTLRSFYGNTANPNSIIYQIFGGTVTNSGVEISPDKAPQMAAVYACVTLIADTIAKLPFNVYIKTQNGQEISEGHRLNKILSKRPNPKYNAIDFKRAMMVNLLLRGNAYALPMRTGNIMGALELIPPDNVTVTYQNGKLTYTVFLDGRNSLELNADQIIHLKAYTFDGINGVSPVTYARETIGTGISASQTLAKHYGKGAVPAGYLVSGDTSRDPERLKAIGTQFDEAVKTGRTPVMPPGTEYKHLPVSLRDSQFIESSKWTTEEVCRIFRVPPHKVGMLEHGMYNNSIEAQNNQFVTDCIQFWVEYIELEFEEKLLSSPLYSLEMDMTSLLRGDTVTQVQRHVSYWNVGAMNVNEIRKENNLPPIEGGEEFMKPMHMANQNDINNGKTNNPKNGPETTGSEPV